MAKLKVKVGDTFINTVDYETYSHYNPTNAVLQSKEYYEEFFLDARLQILSILGWNDSFQRSFQNPQSIKMISVDNWEEEFILLPPWIVYEIVKEEKKVLV